MEGVQKGYSFKRAAKIHKVPRTTLQDRVLSKVMHGTKSGSQLYLVRKKVILLNSLK